jgi:N-acetylmuramoyl-L-alanine amidase
LQHSIQYLSILLVLFLSIVALLLISGRDFQPFQSVATLTEPIPILSVAPSSAPTLKLTGTPLPSLNPSVMATATPSPEPREFPASAIFLPYEPSPELSSTVSPTPSASPTPRPTAATRKASGEVEKKFILCIDPGHGGRYPGTVSPYKDQFYEKYIVLDIGQRLQKLLENAGIEVIMTRETDKYSCTRYQNKNKRLGKRK